MQKHKMAEETLRAEKATLEGEIIRLQLAYSQEILPRQGRLQLINEILGEEPPQAEMETANENGKLEEEVPVS